jgi:hypothetical protein
MKKAEKQNKIKPADTVKTKKTVRKKSIKTIVPSEDAIRARAEEIYLKRIKNGEDGTSEGDWYAALESFNLAGEA